MKGKAPGEKKGNEMTDKKQRVVEWDTFIDALLNTPEPVNGGNDETDI